MCTDVEQTLHNNALQSLVHLVVCPCKFATQLDTHTVTSSLPVSPVSKLVRQALLQLSAAPCPHTASIWHSLMADAYLSAHLFHWGVSSDTQVQSSPVSSNMLKGRVFP